MAKKRRESKPNAVGRRGRAVVTAAVERRCIEGAAAVERMGNRRCVELGATRY
jgi:hypothetical protein